MITHSHTYDHHRLYHRLPADTVALAGPRRAWSRDNHTDSRRTHRLAVGGIEEPLGPGESVMSSGARGHTGFAHTSTRLLIFSTGLRQWREVSLGVEERMERYQLLPFLILAHTNQHVYGF